MPTTTWTYDAPDGVFKNHNLSTQLLEHAAQKWVFVGFTKEVPGGSQKKKGESITIPHYKSLDIPNSGVLEETGRIPIDKLELGTRQIVLSEFGRGVQYTHLMEELSVFDPKSGAQKVLDRQMGGSMDRAAAAAFKQAKVCFIPTSLSGGVWDTDGVASTTALQNMTKAHMGIIRDYMMNDLHVPPYEGNHFVGLFATKALRGLKDDNAIEAWHQYLQKGDLIFNSEIGQVEGIRLSEVNHEAALSNGVGSGACLGEGVVFGDEAVSRAEVETPHLRADPNYQGDFGRIKAVVWYGIVAYGITWDTANDLEAKVVYVTSQ